MIGTFVRGCRCATSWCDLDLTFDLAIMTLSYKILPRLYLGNTGFCKLKNTRIKGNINLGLNIQVKKSSKTNWAFF